MDEALAVPDGPAAFDGLSSQPPSWQAAATLASDVDTSLVLPLYGERAAVLGVSWAGCAGAAYAARRESAEAGETDAFSPSSLPRRRMYDRVVVLTRGGADAATLGAIEHLRDHAILTTVVTASAASPAADLAGHLLVIGDESADGRGDGGGGRGGDGDAVFALTALALLRANLHEDLRTAIADGATALAGDAPDVGASAVVLGDGWTRGIACHAATTLRAGGVAATARPAAELERAEAAMLGPGTTVWAFADVASAVRDGAIAAGATWRRATLDPMAELLLVARAAAGASTRRRG